MMKSWLFDDQNNALRWLESYDSPSSLIYIHGLGCASSSDYPTVLTSAHYLGHHSYLLDLPGAGFSDKPTTAHYDSANQSAILQRWITLQIATSDLSFYAHSAGIFIALKLAAMMPFPPRRLILCSPGLTDYGVSLLKEITSMSESEFVEEGFIQLMFRLKQDAENANWLGPFQVSAPHAVYQWATSALEDNAKDWHSTLADSTIFKGVILPDTAPQEEIEGYIHAGCKVELVANSGHMIAYDNPDGLASAISRLMTSPVKHE